MAGFERVLFDFAQMKFVDHGAQDGIGLDQLDLRGEELVGVVGGVLQRFLAEDAGGHLAIDVDGGGGFVDGREAEGDDQGGEHGSGDERADFPAVAAQNPEIMREGNVRGLRLIFGVEDGNGGRRWDSVGFGNGRKIGFELLHVLMPDEDSGGGGSAEHGDAVERGHGGAAVLVVGDVEQVVDLERRRRGICAA